MLLHFNSRYIDNHNTNGCSRERSVSSFARRAGGELCWRAEGIVAPKAPAVVRLSGGAWGTGRAVAERLRVLENRAADLE